MSVNEPLFDVELTKDELTPDVPCAVLYGVTPNNTFIPVNIDEHGKLGLGGSISVGDVRITGVDPENSFSEEDIAVKNLGPTNGYAMRTSIFGPSGDPLAVNNDGSLNVNVVASTPGLPINVFNRALGVPSGTDQVILTYVVPAGKTLHLTQLIAWGDYDGEFLIKVDATIVGGGRTSGAARTLQLDYTSAPIYASASAVVAVTIRHYASSSYTFSANLLGGLF